MKRSDLKTGMTVQLENGGFRIVLLNTESGDAIADRNLKECQDNLFRRLHNYYGLDNFDEDLISKHANVIKNIDKVYSQYGKLLWDRNAIDWKRCPRLEGSAPGVGTFQIIEIGEGSETLKAILVVKGHDEDTVGKTINLCKRSWEGTKVISYLIN